MFVKKLFKEEQKEKTRLNSRKKEKSYFNLSSPNSPIHKKPTLGSFFGCYQTMETMKNFQNGNSKNIR